MKKLFSLLAIVGMLLIGGVNNGVYATETSKSPEYFQNISVVIDTPVLLGSGIVFTRKDSTGTNDVTFIWSASHLISNTERILAEVFSISTITNAKLKLQSVVVSQHLYKDGKCVSTNSVEAKVLKCGSTNSEDAVVFMIPGRVFGTNTAIFDLSGQPPKLGEKLYSVSAPFGDEGTYSEGIVSFVGRSIKNIEYDQITCITYQGSSGGGVFNAEGKCIGLINMLDAPNIGFIVPIRNIQKWAKEQNIEWAMDPSVPMP